MTSSMRSQRGATLIVVMILLLVFAVMTAAAFRGSLTSAQAIGNMQWRNEAIAAANDAIDRLLSTPDFAINSATVTQAVKAAPFTLDANGDGVTDITVGFPDVTIDGVTRAGPRCMRAAPIPSGKLDANAAADIGCFSSNKSEFAGLEVAAGAGAGAGGAPVAQQPSLCSNTEWSITVRAVDAVTNTQVNVVQGVGVRVLTTDIPTCN